MAKTTKKTSSTSDSSPTEEEVSIGGRRFHPYRLMTQHVYVLDELIEETYPKHEHDQTSLNQQLLLVTRRLRPLYPPPLCRSCLEGVFPVIDWKPPNEKLRTQWLGEIPDADLEPAADEATELIEKAERRILSSYLFNLLTDPENTAEHVVHAIYRMWQTSANGTACCACEAPIVCGQAGLELLRKVDLLLENKEADFTADEARAVVYHASPDGAAITALKGKDEPWLKNSLLGLDFTALTAAREKLKSLLG